MIAIQHIDDEQTILYISKLIATHQKSDKHVKVAQSLEFEAINRALKYEKSAVLGAFNRKNCIGFIWAKLEQQHKQVKIHNLFVVEAFRNQGIASRLKEEIERWAIENNASSIVTTVDSKNEAMIHINQSNGYQTEKLIMRKNLLNRKE